MSSSPQQVPPGAPPPPPALNQAHLWVSIAMPPALMALLLVGMIFRKAIVPGLKEGLYMQFMCLLVCIATVAGWGLFINTLVRRFRGASLVLLILAYPMMQFVVLFALFFAGCFLSISSTL